MTALWIAIGLLFLWCTALTLRISVDTLRAARARKTRLIAAATLQAGQLALRSVRESPPLSTSPDPETTSPMRGAQLQSPHKLEGEY